TGVPAVAFARSTCLRSRSVIVVGETVGLRRPRAWRASGVPLCTDVVFIATSPLPLIGWAAIAPEMDRNAADLPLSARVSAPPSIWVGDYLFCGAGTGARLT